MYLFFDRFLTNLVGKHNGYFYPFVYLNGDYVCLKSSMDITNLGCFIGKACTQ